MNALLKKIRYLGDFSRRTKRKEFILTWLCILPYIIATWYGIIIFVFEPTSRNFIFATPIIVFFVHSYWLLFANYASRIRDFGSNPAWCLAIVIPLLNLVLIGFMLFAPSKK